MICLPVESVDAIVDEAGFAKGFSDVTQNHTRHGDYFSFLSVDS